MISAINTLAPMAQAGPQQQSPIFFFGWMAIMIAIFYIIAIRPQKRREKERRTLIDNIKSGDRVIFCGGIIGNVTNIKDKTFTIKIAEKVKVEVTRSAVTDVLGKGEKPDDAKAA